MTIIETILNVGAIAGLISIFLEMHQSRRNRPSFLYTEEGMHSDEQPYLRDGMTFTGQHFRGLIRNASLNANTIVRLYLVVWEGYSFTKVHWMGLSFESMIDLATNELLALPLRMEGRSAVHAEIEFEVRLTDANGKLTFNGEFMADYDHPLRRGGQSYDFIIEDAAGNYFHRNGRLLSRTVINLYTTLVNYKGRRRFRHRLTIARWWLQWKLEIVRSWFGFYK